MIFSYKTVNPWKDFSLYKRFLEEFKNFENFGATLEEVVHHIFPIQSASFLIFTPRALFLSSLYFFPSEIMLITCSFHALKVQIVFYNMLFV